jgi:23S rRNA (cytidine1920-2'-O)/16S rRNA (cytidine1409-2'-O)-methyltransferase
MGSRPRFRNVISHVRAVRPDIVDPMSAIHDRRLLVGGVIVTSPRSNVPVDAPVVLRPPAVLRGEAKLEAALAAFHLDVTNAVCLDVGASAGGFTRVLIRRGARLVYALDVGVGQLRGALRTHRRVRSLERTNVADASRILPADPPIDVITVDLTYVSLAQALPQLAGIPLSDWADLVALVKPQFELGLRRSPLDVGSLDRALARARQGASSAGWNVVGSINSPVPGRRGSREFLLYATRRRGTG